MQRYIGHHSKKKIHHDMFPETFRMLIIGPSGTGKTCLLMRMLLEDTLLNYDKLLVFARSLYQPQYEALKAGLDFNLPKDDIIKLINSSKLMKKHESNIEEIAEALMNLNLEEEKEESNIEAEFHETAENIPDPSSIDRSIRNLIVFDDIMTDKKQTMPEAYYTRGRSANCDCIYLSQNYTHLPLHTIRSNSNFLVFFKSSPLVAKQLYDNFSSVDMDYKTWKDFCKTGWKNKYNFIVIDMSRDYDSGNKYRFQLELN